MSLLEIKSTTITEKGQIVIPKDIREKEGFKIGSKIAVLAYSDHIELRPLKEISKKMETAIASEKSLSKDWLSEKEDKAWKDL